MRKITSNTKNDTFKLGCWLLYKGETSLLKIVIIIFFLRAEELIEGNIENSFFDHNYNFHSWEYGPINPYCYNMLKQYFSGRVSKDRLLLSDDDIGLIENKYNRYYQKYKDISLAELLYISRLNLGWQKYFKKTKANNNIACGIKETDEDFLKFEYDPHKFKIF